MICNQACIQKPRGQAQKSNHHENAMLAIGCTPQGKFARRAAVRKPGSAARRSSRSGEAEAEPQQQPWRSGGPQPQPWRPILRGKYLKPMATRPFVTSRSHVSQASQGLTRPHKVSQGPSECGAETIILRPWLESWLASCWPGCRSGSARWRGFQYSRSLGSPQSVRFRRFCSGFQRSRSVNCPPERHMRVWTFGLRMLSLMRSLHDTLASGSVPKKMLAKLSNGF